MFQDVVYQKMFLLFILVIFFAIQSEAYVLLQVREQDGNYSNVDALIHKKIPSGKFEKFAKSFGRKGFEVVQDQDVSESDEEGDSNTLSIPEPAPVRTHTTREPNLIDLIGLVGKKVQQSPSGPLFRSRDDEVIFRPKRVQLNRGESSVYNVDPDKLILAMRDLLSSATLKKYVEKLSRKAAAVYGTVENDLQPLAYDVAKIIRKNVKVLT